MTLFWNVLSFPLLYHPNSTIRKQSCFEMSKSVPTLFYYPIFDQKCDFWVRFFSKPNVSWSVFLCCFLWRIPNQTMSKKWQQTLDFFLLWKCGKKLINWQYWLCSKGCVSGDKFTHLWQSFGNKRNNNWLRSTWKFGLNLWLLPFVLGMFAQCCFFGTLIKKRSKKILIPPSYIFANWCHCSHGILLTSVQSSLSSHIWNNCHFLPKILLCNIRPLHGLIEGGIFSFLQIYLILYTI